MKTAYNTHLGSNACNINIPLSFEHDWFQDIIPIFYQYINFTDVKNNFSLVCKKWRFISDDKTKIITIFRAFYTNEGLLAISQRFEKVEKFEISDIWVNLNPDKLLTPEELERAYEIEEINQALRLYHFNYGHPNPVTDEGIKHFKNLTFLDLNFDSTITDDCIKKFTTLKILELQRNGKISDEGLKNLTGLTFLNLTINEIISNATIMALTNLIELDLSGNMQITNSALPTLTNLTTLDLSDSKIGNYSQIGNLINLKTLTLSEHIVDSDIVNLTNLCHLDMCSNKNITDNGMSTLTNLTYLDLEYINLSNLTLSEFKKLTCLSAIYLTDDSIAHLTNLQSLILNVNCKISADGIKPLIKLNDLQIYGINLLNDDWIPHLTNLTELYLDEDFLPGKETIENIRQTLTNLNNLDFLTSSESIISDEDL